MLPMMPMMIDSPETAPALPVRIHRIYQTLATARSLEPSEDVSLLFRELVRISTSRSSADARSVLGDPIIGAIQENLWRVCGRGEYLLELHWSQRIAAAADPWAELERFPYYTNYEKLTRLEVNGLGCALDAPPQKILFVGSGPLPLTSIVLAHRHGLAVSNVDIDESACDASYRLVHRLGLAAELDITCSDILALTDLAAYDVVILAALVGLSRREKARLLAHLGAAMRPGALLLARSSQMLRALLYPRLDIHDMGIFEPVVEIHPHDEIINSIIVARKPHTTV